MKYIKLTLYSIFTGLALGVITVACLYFYFKDELPSVDVLKDVRLQTPMKVYTQDGKLISQFGVKRRIPLSIDEIPEQLKQAIIATEDSRFYQHYGVDPIGVVRAAINLIVTGERGQGASTLTMQMARGFFLTREKQFVRKIREAFIALHMEQTLTKDEILELYINKVELGHRAFGFGAAAQVYYGKDIDELNLAQIATLAGLPQAPSVLNPISRPERSLNRRRIVLLRMLDEGYIDRSQYDAALNEPVTARKHGAEIALDAPYLADHIYNEMIELYGKDEAETGGYQVYATVSSELQLAAQQAVRQNLHDYDERHGYRGPIKYLWNAPLQDDEEAQEEHSTKPYSEAQIMTVLDSHNIINPLLPAVVTRVYKDSFEVLLKETGYQRIDWEGLVWARKFISDTKQGPSVKKASDVVAEGQLILVRQRPQDEKWQLAQMPDVSGALVAMDPNNGAVQAVIGGYSFYQSQFNRATQAKRQVGSNIKPFIYSAALENGYTLASVINDAPISQWDKRTGVAWRPENSPPVYDGPIRMRKALGLSKNVVSVRLLRALGIDNAIQHLTKFGFDKDELPKDETLSLGSSSHTPLEVVTAVSTIANGGYAVQPYFIERIDDGFGTNLWTANPPIACNPCELTAQTNVQEDDIEALLEAELSAQQSESNDKPDQLLAEQVISSQNAFLVSEMMRSAVTINGNWNKRTYWQGTGWRAKNILKRNDLHGKTGTTNDARDAWFSGFNQNIVATSWTGFDNMNRILGRMSINQPLRDTRPDDPHWIGNAMAGVEQGSYTSQPTWIRFMQVALAGQPETSMQVPENIVNMRIDRASGQLTKRTDHTAMFEYFAAGTEPTNFVELVIDPAEDKDTKQEEETIF